MRDEENYGDLARLFAAEDATLEAAPFTAGVMKGIRRQTMIRRLTVGAFGFAGAVIALLQLPELLSAFVGVDHTMWLAVIMGAALSMAAVSMTERT